MFQKLTCDLADLLSYNLAYGQNEITHYFWVRVIGLGQLAHRLQLEELCHSSVLACCTQVLSDSS